MVDNGNYYCCSLSSFVAICRPNHCPSSSSCTQCQRQTILLWQTFYDDAIAHFHHFDAFTDIFMMGNMKALAKMHLFAFSPLLSLRKCSSPWPKARILYLCIVIKSDAALNRLTRCSASTFSSLLSPLKWCGNLICLQKAAISHLYFSCASVLSLGLWKILLLPII